MYDKQIRFDFRPLGREIKRKRESMGWTQEHLAGGGLQGCAERIARAAEQAEGGEKENGSILLVRAEVTNETDQL